MLRKGEQSLPLQLAAFLNGTLAIVVNFSHLKMFQIIQEWTAIDIKNPDLTLMAAIKITDVSST